MREASVADKCLLIAICNDYYYYNFMVRAPSSIKQKLALFYVVALILMAVVIIVNRTSLGEVEKMVESGAIVSDLFDTTLEIKRFEKNYFLYKKDEDYSELFIYVNKAEGLLANNRSSLGVFAKNDELLEIGKDLQRYKELLKALPSIDTDISSSEEILREVGRRLVTAAEKLSKTEREIMQETLWSARHKVLLSIMFFMAAGSIGAILFYKKMIQPLRILEEHMERVSMGEFSPVPIETRDKEMISLNSAFNRMLHELEERKGYLVQSEKLASLGTLLFGVAHELNNPISNISTSAQILREEIESGDDEYKKELLTQIEDETDRAKNIVNSMLGYSRKSDKEMVNLKKAVDETLHFLRGDIPTKVQLSIKIPGNIEFVADKQKLQQVFINLIKNSVDSISDEGKIVIAAKKIPENGRIEIVVSDTGSGMSEEMVQNIFSPFFTTKKTKKSYGLGLFIVHNIIKELGGSIIVESEPGYGTSFIIEIFPKE